MAIGHDCSAPGICTVAVTALVDWRHHLVCVHRADRVASLVRHDQDIPRRPAVIRRRVGEETVKIR